MKRFIILAALLFVLQSWGKIQSPLTLAHTDEAPIACEEFQPELHRFIKFSFKNNSLRRIQCYVKGPKSDGSHFSYGFPMNPGQKRDKDWSVGSKVYQVNRLGLMKLLLEIKAEDEGKVVKLYQ